ACHSIYVADHGWHTGLILLGQDFDPRTTLRTTYFDRKQWLEFGWGDAAFYQADGISVTLALRALFSPTDAVMHVYAFDGAPAGNFPESKVIRLRVTTAGYRRMMGFIRDAFARDANGHVEPIKRGLYGRSHFFKALGTYSLLRTCNTWTAEALHEAGVNVDPGSAATSGDLMAQLEGVDASACEAATGQ
ncbi:MAG: TIGR02117 family protein, partial [Alphaproteobacteria bacterium]|nr:TIGR02117 family protein [Alphaproteobacteria bacterium]